MDQTYLLAGVSDPATYLNLGWVSISVPNLIVILAMIAIIVLAILVPFPKDKDGS